MNEHQDQSFGLCPVCGAAFIRNRRDKFKSRKITLVGDSLPDKAYYPEVHFDLIMVWCPGCGLVKSVQSTNIGFLWINPEFEECRRKQSTGSEPGKPLLPAT